MSEHWHWSIENVLFAGISAIIVFNVVRVGSAWMLNSSNSALQNIGKGLGATVTFHGTKAA